MWLGVLGVAMFAVTLPMTRLATGTADAPQLSPWFVTLGRAALAGVCSVLFLLATRSPVPQRQHWRPLGVAVLGNAVGYPLLLAYALRVVTASHAAVITALLPLVLQRLLLHDGGLPDKLLPTLAILIAPPAVAMLAWQSLTGEVGDPVGRILYAAAMFFVILLAVQFGRLRRVPFALPYWAYTFPLAAASAAAVTVAGSDAVSGVAYDVVAVLLLTASTVLVLVVATLTLRAAGRGQICVPEP